MRSKFASPMETIASGRESDHSRRDKNKLKFSSSDIKKLNLWKKVTLASSSSAVSSLGALGSSSAATSSLPSESTVVFASSPS